MSSRDPVRLAGRLKQDGKGKKDSSSCFSRMILCHKSHFPHGPLPQKPFLAWSFATKARTTSMRHHLGALKIFLIILIVIVLCHKSQDNKHALSLRRFTNFPSFSIIVMVPCHKSQDKKHAPSLDPLSVFPPLPVLYSSPFPGPNGSRQLPGGLTVLSSAGSYRFSLRHLLVSSLQFLVHFGTVVFLPVTDL